LAGSSRCVIFFLTVAFVCAFAFNHELRRSIVVALPIPSTHLHISRASPISYDSRRFTLHARRETAYMPSQHPRCALLSCNVTLLGMCGPRASELPCIREARARISHACCGAFCVTSDATACTLWRFEHGLAATAHQALPRFFLLPCFSFAFAWSPLSRGVAVLILDWCDGVNLLTM
jgi:hypothetical protein